MTGIFCKICGQSIKLDKAKTLGERVRALRNQNDLGLRELARALDISPTTITRIEQGHFNVHFDKIIKIAKYFEVSVDFLLNGNKQKETP